MTEAPTTSLTWTKIVLILLGVGLGAGLLLGGLGSVFELSASFTTSGVGAAIGVTAALLLTRRSVDLKSEEHTEN